MTHELTFTLLEDETPQELVEKLEALIVGKVTGYKVTNGIYVTMTISEGEYETDIDYSRECKMCGCEWPLNDNGYCSRCWVIWNS